LRAPCPQGTAPAAPTTALRSLAARSAATFGFGVMSPGASPDHAIHANQPVWRAACLRFVGGAFGVVASVQQLSERGCPTTAVEFGAPGGRPTTSTVMARLEHDRRALAPPADVTGSPACNSDGKVEVMKLEAERLRVSVGRSWCPSGRAPAQRQRYLTPAEPSEMTRCLAPGVRDVDGRIAR